MAKNLLTLAFSVVLCALSGIAPSAKESPSDALVLAALPVFHMTAGDIDFTIDLDYTNASDKALEYVKGPSYMAPINRIGIHLVNEKHDYPVQFASPTYATSVDREALSILQPGESTRLHLPVLRIFSKVSPGTYRVELFLRKPSEGEDEELQLKATHVANLEIRTKEPPTGSGNASSTRPTTTRIAH